MIYNIVEYLRNELPGETIYANSMQLIDSQDFVPDRYAIVRDTSGSLTPWFQFSRETYQIITRDRNEPGARKLAYDIFNILNNHFGLILPAVIVGTQNYSEVITAQISAIQNPYYLDMDDQGRHQYTTNYYFIRKLGG